MISYRKSLGQSSLTADGLVLEDDGGFSFEFDVSSKHDRATALDGGLIRLGRGVCFAVHCSCEVTNEGKPLESG